MSLQEIVIQQLFNGLLLGSFYGLVALGYSMVYGIIRLLNFAHADIYMVGGFCSLSLLTFFGGTFIGNGWLGIIVSMFITMIIVGLLGVVIERVAYKPLREAPRLSLLISALGVSMILYNSAMVVTSGEYRPYKTGLSYEGFSIGSVFITHTQAILIVAAVILMLILHLFITRTMYGKAMRAISMDRDCCRLMGVNVNKIIALTFFVGTALAASAGMMAGVYYGSLHFYMGFVIGIKAFTAAVIGGIGIIPGAMLGGLMLGLLESFGTQIPFIGSAWKDVFSFIILILILIFKPTGLLGKKESERM
ncbi:MAG: branched-chain amino acid ABC transporter permease [Bacillota bacterium]|nr:branched-chain amino acid ABC transporter permease [Bacillota bacterium]MDD3297936.1 branched-chain amino acid ABC transporter permease [Bacillota bacterium]MDD3850594.1 branched-chain amino acid ABC transporter permease [Bacillota bacterium]MDD4707382.1 branched-chain amino acid ABC transporter permease [Bacillota bacterium]